MKYEIFKSKVTGKYYIEIDGKKYGITQWVKNHDAKVKAELLQEIEKILNTHSAMGAYDTLIDMIEERKNEIR